MSNLLHDPSRFETFADQSKSNARSYWKPEYSLLVIIGNRLIVVLLSHKSENQEDHFLKEVLEQLYPISRYENIAKRLIYLPYLSSITCRFLRLNTSSSYPEKDVKTYNLHNFQLGSAAG